MTTSVAARRRRAVLLWLQLLAAAPEASDSTGVMRTTPRVKVPEDALPGVAARHGCRTRGTLPPPARRLLAARLAPAETRDSQENGAARRSFLAWAMTRCASHAARTVEMSGWPQSRIVGPQDTAGKPREVLIAAH